jgi:hypothetical protein
MKYLAIHTLEKGWHDSDEVLLHAAFQILVDFVEKERPDKIIDWSHDEIHRRVWKEIRELYRWWKEKRPARKSPLDDEKLGVPSLRFKKIPGSEMRELVRPDKKKYAAYYRAMRRHTQLEEKWHEEDQRNLHRLIEIRAYLWT